MPVQPAWHNHARPGHWLKHGMLPVLLIAGLLTLPNPWLNQLHAPWLPTLELSLQPVYTPEPLPEPLSDSEPPETNMPEPEPISEVDPWQPVAAPQVTDEPPPAEPETVDQPAKPVIAPIQQNPPAPAITSGDILLMSNNRTSIEITPEFQARNGPPRDFYIPQQEIENWLDDIPYLDESVDRPTIEMRFYAAGIEGQVEKFFDKITISKTFTTKYGTKIHCALIGVVAACSWK